jgi:hypothetical protein
MTDAEAVRVDKLSRALRDVLGEGEQGRLEALEFSRVFRAPADAFEYVRSFGFQVSIGGWPFNPMPRMAPRSGRPEDYFISIRRFLLTAIQSGGYPVAELDAGNRVDDRFFERFSGYGFKRLSNEGVPGAYAGHLASRGLGLKRIISLWRSRLPLEYALAGLDD